MLKHDEILRCVETIVAPKRHRCDGCGLEIAVGMSYLYLYYSGGSFRRLHEDCYRAVQPELARGEDPRDAANKGALCQ